MTHVTQRFTNRVADYIRYRPHYPLAILDTLRTACGLTPQAVIADIGSGTGISTKLFLDNGNHVYAVEPNTAMRQAAEQQLHTYPTFHTLDATAEATTLPAQTVDFIIAGQAFHWFERTPTRNEFARILKPSGWVVLIWNERQTNTSPFLIAYEQLLLDYGTDYAQVNHAHISASIINQFFAPYPVYQQAFPNYQTFDFTGLQGRLLSSSYTPTADHPNYQPMLDHLRQLFDTHQRNGTIQIDYTTKIYYGQLHQP